MVKYTVTLTQAHIRYTQAIVEVDADVDAVITDIADMAKAKAFEWKPTDDEDSGSLDIEVESEHCPTESWRED